MIKSKRQMAGLCLAMAVPLISFAESSFIEGNDSFALVEDRSQAMTAPVAKSQDQMSDVAEEQAFVQESLPATANQLPAAEEMVSFDTVKLLEKIQQLQQEVQELRGQMEVQAHDLKLLQQQQLAFYKDIDARLADQQNDQPQSLALDSSATPSLEKTEAKPEEFAVKETNPVQATKAQARVKGNPADEQISYLAAYELVKNKKYDEALAAMKRFVDKFPQGGYTANAYYWMGELYLVKKEPQQAIEQFKTVLSQFPSSSKTAASLLKVAYALIDEGQYEQAKGHLRQVIQNYPDTQTARLARHKLEMIETI